MGALTSRQNAGVEVVDSNTNHAYKYPPRSGSYFSTHFIMGGEKFDTPQPEAFLFGENADLNFLGSKPSPFPYPPPQANEPTKTLKCLVNIRKESLRFVRASLDCGKVPANADGIERDGEVKGASYNIEFTFDADVRCSITVYYFCTEEMTPTGIQYVSRDSSVNSETFHYKKGANQQFCQPMHVFDPSKFPNDDLYYSIDREIIPIAIHCVAEENNDEFKQSHTTIAIAERHPDATYVIKALKQKIFVDGLCYLLQEIYGIENKNLDKNVCDDDGEDNGSECVICMCDTRDTLILPCRHLCLCNSCADSLRYQANNCPICRAPFRALLQIRALQKCNGSSPQLPPATPTDGSCENLPAGYEPVSLIEALNGPNIVHRRPPSAPAEYIESTPEADVSIQAAQVLNRSNLEKNTVRNSTEKDPKDIHASRERLPTNLDTAEFRMSVLMQREDEGLRETSHSPLLQSQSPPPPYQFKATSSPGAASQNGTSRGNKIVKHHKDSIRLINEKRNTHVENPDDDSETEKMSPLLDKSVHVVDANVVQVESRSAIKPNKKRDRKSSQTNHKDALGKTQSSPGATKIDKLNSTSTSPTSDNEIVDHSNKTYGYKQKNEKSISKSAPGLIMPSAQNNLSVVVANNSNNSDVSPSKECNSMSSTPMRHPLGASLPGTPVSTLSGRSSGESYSSGGSTKQLLTVATSDGSSTLSQAIEQDIRV